MTTKLPRHLAEACLEQIKIQFKGEIKAGYGDPNAVVETKPAPELAGGGARRAVQRRWTLLPVSSVMFHVKPRRAS